MIESNHQFPGFSIPEGAWMPPELMDILPYIGGGELKVIVAALYETLRVGVVEAVVSLTEFEALTGLSRKSVIAGIQRAVERGIIRRQQVGQVYLYRLHFKPAGKGTGPASVKSTLVGVDSPLPASVKSTLVGVESTLAASVKSTQTSGESTLVGGDSPPHVVCMHVTSCPENIQQQQQRAELVAKMRELGVALKVAQQMAARYEPEYLLEKLEQALYAVERGLADNGPGWFVCSVRENWQAPLGYTDEAKPKVGSEADRKRYIEGKYADLIQH